MHSFNCHSCRTYGLSLKLSRQNSSQQPLHPIMQGVDTQLISKGSIFTFILGARLLCGSKLWFASHCCNLFHSQYSHDMHNGFIILFINGYDFIETLQLNMHPLHQFVMCSTDHCGEKNILFREVGMILDMHLVESAYKKHYLIVLLFILFF